MSLELSQEDRQREAYNALTTYDGWFGVLGAHWCLYGDCWGWGAFARFGIETLWNLGHNLAIAGALCESFDLGYQWGSDIAMRSPPLWHPNTQGEPVPSVDPWLYAPLTEEERAACERAHEETDPWE